MIKWIKEGGVEVETNEMPVTIAKARSLGWKTPEEIEAESKPKTVDDMGAPELKELCKELDIEYTTKPEAIDAIKAKQAESEE